jgi:hypothetical protein
LVSFLALLPRALTTFLFALAALLRFYGNTDTKFLHLTSLGWSLLAFNLGAAALVVNLGLEWNAGNRSRSQAKDYEQRKKDYEQRKKGYKQENAKLDAMILQTRNDTKQIEKETEQLKKENARLAELESKIDGLFSKYNINSSPGKTPEQP